MAAGLALVAALLWGLADYGGGALTRRAGVAPVLAVGIPAGCLATAVLWLALGRPGMPASAVLLAVAAGLVDLAFLGVFYRALAVGPMGVVAPIVATSAATPAVVDIVRNGRPGAVMACGFVAAIAGVALVALRPPRDGPAARSSRLPLRGAAAASVLLGVSLTLLHDASARSSPVPALLVSRAAMAVVCAPLLVRVARSRIAMPPRLLAAAGAVGGLDLAAFGLFTVASVHTRLAVAAVLSSLYPLVTAATARVLERERLTRRQRAGGLLAVAGTVAIIAS